MYTIIIIIPENRLILKKRKLLNKELETIARSEMEWEKYKNTPLSELIEIFENDLKYVNNKE